MKTLDERNKGKRVKESESEEEGLREAGVLPTFQTVRQCGYPPRKKPREIKKFDDTIETNIIKLRKLPRDVNYDRFKIHYEIYKINGYYLQTIFCILLRERKFTREQVSELFGITLQDATKILKGKFQGLYFDFELDKICERMEKLGYTIALEE